MKSLEDLEKDLQKGSLENLYLLYGEERFLLESSLKKIEKLFGEKIIGINYILKDYDKAIELCSTDQNKAAISLKVANALSKSGDYERAYSYLDKAVGFNSAISGKANLIRAQIKAKEKKFDEAIALCTQAAQEDVSISGSADRLKAVIVDVKQKNAEYERQNAEYKAAKAKQEELEKFWKEGE